MLLPGMGTHHHPIATKIPLAQKFFDQGFTLIFAFNHDEAVRSFQRSAELDPSAAMPHWGIALALGPNINLDVDPEREKAAFDAVVKALSLAASAPEHERAYIQALAKRYSGDPKADLKKLAVDYKNAMAELVRRYPDDLDLAVLYAESMMDLRPWQLWTPDGKPAEGTEEIVSVLESVIRRDPRHVGANHYYIHAVEASQTPERALPSAARMADLVPGAGHLVHMPGHIYLRTGDFEAAAKTNERAAQADRDYIRRTGATGVYPLMYYTHNLHFIAVARAEEGRFEESKRAADQLYANIKPALKEMPMIEGFAPIPIFMLMRFHKWDQILKLVAPDATSTVTAAAWHFGRASALAATGKPREAEAAAQEFEAARAKVAAEAMMGNNSALNIFKVASASLHARLAGDGKTAIERWRKAVEAQDSLAYDEPPGWYYPVRESLGAEMLRDGDAAGAEKIFREALAANPRNGRLLFGLWQSLQAQKKATDAAYVQREFEAAWKNAPIKLTLDQL
ncbi:MAG: hypothetical protein ABIZ80_18970 [Bryobacteraceae bacterium]